MKRRFLIYTDAHVADPAHLVPVWDITDTDNVMHYTDLSEIKKVVQETEYNIAFSKGRFAGIKEMCKLFGVKNSFELSKIAEKYFKSTTEKDDSMV